MSTLCTILALLGLIAFFIGMQLLKWMIPVRYQIIARRASSLGFLFAPATIAISISSVRAFVFGDSPMRYLAILVFAWPGLPISGVMLYESFYPILVLSSFENRSFRRSIGSSLEEVFGSCQILTLETYASLAKTADKIYAGGGFTEHIPDVVYLRTPWWGRWEDSAEWLMRYAKVIVIDASVRSPSLVREMQIVESDEGIKERALVITEYGATRSSIADAVRRELPGACDVRSSKPLWFAYLAFVLLHLGVVAAS